MKVNSCKENRRLRELLIKSTVRVTVNLTVRVSVRVTVRLTVRLTVRVSVGARPRARAPPKDMGSGGSSVEVGEKVSYGRYFIYASSWP